MFKIYYFPLFCFLHNMYPDPNARQVECVGADFFHRPSSHRGHPSNLPPPRFCTWDPPAPALAQGLSCNSYLHVSLSSPSWSSRRVYKSRAYERLYDCRVDPSATTTPPALLVRVTMTMMMMAAMVAENMHRATIFLSPI